MPIKLYLINETQLRQWERLLKNLDNADFIPERQVSRGFGTIANIEQHELKDVNRQLQELLGDSENNGI